MKQAAAVNSQARFRDMICCKTMPDRSISEAEERVLICETDPFASMLAENLGKVACQLINDNRDALICSYSTELKQLKVEMKQLEDELRTLREKSGTTATLQTPQSDTQESLKSVLLVENSGFIQKSEEVTPKKLDTVPECEFEDLKEEAGLEELDLRRMFERMTSGHQNLHVSTLVDHCFEDEDEDIKSKTHLRWKSAVTVFNKDLGVLASKELGVFNYAAFRTLIMASPTVMKDKYNQDVFRSLMEMRKMLIQDTMVDKIAKAWRVCGSAVVDYDLEVANEPSKDVCIKFMEPVVAVIIIANSLTLGISLDVDHDWDGWFFIEGIFTFFFVVEFMIKLWAHGCERHFCGEEYAWNWFDFGIVLFGLLDCIMTIGKKTGAISDMVNLNTFTVLRLARLVRITRLVRLMRLKMFKELTLMVNGVIAGLKTLFWAMVMLFVFVYAMGVLMRQLMGPEYIRDTDCEYSPPKLGTKLVKLSVRESDCLRSIETMDKYSLILFGDVARSMMTVFNCFTDGCNSPDGTPLIWHLWAMNGPIMVLLFVGAYLFVTFGVLNLIMAVFVENTLSSAQRLEGERQFGKHEDHVDKAHRLQVLLHKLCQGDTVETDGKRRTVVQTVKSLWQHERRDPSMDPVSMNMRIDQDVFEKMLLDAQVQDLLDDLDISSISRQQLFDILDADGNGYLAISELVDGIMKLRGPADKGDIVSTVLMVRCVQKAIRKLEGNIVSHAELLRKLGEDLTNLPTNRNLRRSSRI